MTECTSSGKVIDPPGEARHPSEAGDLSDLLRRYYRNQTIHQRILDFLQGAEYIVGNDGFSDLGESSTISCLPQFLESGLELDRSLWDHQALIADIDLEYHNFDYPAAAWLDPDKAFKLQQPVLDAALHILGESGVAPMTLVSGRGFHLVWAVSRKSRAFRRLAGLGRVPSSLEARYAQPCSPGGSNVEPDLGRAFAGLGLLLEFVGHRVLRASEHRCLLPVQPTAIEVGPGIGGREIVSFDLSEYGDPLHTRHVRLPFSAYLKPRQFHWTLGEAGMRALLPIFTIPLSGMTTAQAIYAARDPDKVIELAGQVSTIIPDRSEEMNELLDKYEHSELFAFHKQFYSQLRETPASLSARIPGAPPCVEWLLEHPNDWLLKPAALQHVVRVLTALDYNPASIAHLTSASYRADASWGDLWTRLDPCNRAIFYTRLFAGMIAMGTDRLIDMNCVSQREKGYCMIPDCSFNLALYRDMLLQRRTH
ncbi:MAG: hypothetical protein ABSB35_36790 [Bryobacteraceae bacterium]|jgi:hypothetical protein